MSKNTTTQATAKDELCEKLRDLVAEKHEIKAQIRETEKQIDQLQHNTNKTG
jgi:uncharacterized protein Yka (UPF0111/DUF47 family)